MFCPSCGSEYRAGFTECPDCGVSLTELPPMPGPDDPHDPRHQKLVEVYRSGLHDSEAIRELLEGSGIPATLDNQGGGGYPLRVGTMGEAGVFVRAEDAEAALDTIRAAQSGLLALDESSPPT